MECLNRSFFSRNYEDIEERINSPPAYKQKHYGAQKEREFCLFHFWPLLPENLRQEWPRRFCLPCHRDVVRHISPASENSDGPSIPHLLRRATNLHEIRHAARRQNRT